MGALKRHRIVTMQQLKGYFSEGSFAIPNLQREFVWNARKAAELADSIYKGFPIGMILIWRTNSTKELRKLHGILPPFDPAKNKHCLYLLDGQQRIGVICRFYNPDQVVENERGQKIDFNKICFRTSESKFTYLNEEPDEKDHFSLTKILNGQYSHSKKMTKNKQIKLRKVTWSFENLKLPFFFIENQEQDYVKEAFIRLNSRGTPLKSADKVLTRACDIRLRDKILDFKEQLLHSGFSNIENSTITDALMFCRDLKDISENAKETMMKEINRKAQEFDAEWDITKKSIGKGIDLLRKSFGVGHANVLPSKTIIPILSVFFYYNDNKNPTNHQRDEIRKWFWLSALTSRYTGKLYRKSIIQDIGKMKDLAKSHIATKLRFERPEIDDLVRTDYSKNSATVRAYFCLLSIKEPLYLENGEKINLENPVVLLDKKNKHHIFPRKPLIKAGIAARKYNSIVNICYLPLQENTGIQDKLPCEYLQDYRDSKQFKKIMRSHLIPCETGSAVWKEVPKEAFANFLDERKKIIAGAFETAAFGKGSTQRIFER